jgi:hypothetical protein
MERLAALLQALAPSQATISQVVIFFVNHPPPEATSPSFPLPLHSSDTMTTRIIALRRGKTGDIQSFSLARPANPTVTDVLSTTLGGVNQAFRTQVLGDPANVHQFACVFGDSLGLFTRPTVIPNGTGGFNVLGNFTDTLGEPCPLLVTLAEFQGHFTTLVRKEDAQAFGLATHPTGPDTVEGPTIAGRRLEATLGRLNFPVPEFPDEGELPVIAALPNFLPIGPGQTFPHLLSIMDPTSFRDGFPLFETYNSGLAYARAYNDGNSVTVGGPLFHLPSLTLAPGVADPFALLTIGPPPRLLNALLPNHPLYPRGRDLLQAWSETIWIELGSAMDPEPVPAVGGGGFTPATLRAVLEPLVAKEKTFANAPRGIARYRLLMAASPDPGSTTPDSMVLPELCDEFKVYISINSSAIAAQDLQELVKSKLRIANASRAAIDKDVTLESANITVAFSDRIRTYAWLDEKMVIAEDTHAKSKLGMLQFLTPDRAGLAVVVDSDRDAATLLMSNSSSSTAQLDASKSSKLYCGGHLRTFRHSYEAVCNLRCLLSVIVEDLVRPLVLVKLLEYVSLLVDREGRLFFDTFQGRSPHLALHPFQDLQTILSAFVSRVTTDANNYGAASRGEPIAVRHYESAIQVADALTADLRAILHGNGLGKFQDIPTFAEWYLPNKPIVTPPRGGAAALPGKEPKRQRTSDAATPPGRPAVDAAVLETRKALGLLVFDSAVAGSTRLPNINVYHKKQGAKSPERLCLKFLTRGFACDKEDCKLPHVTGLNVLRPAERTKLIDFVKKQPGMAWAEGKGPAGTS